MPITLTAARTRAAREFGEPAMTRIVEAAWTDYILDGVIDFAAKTKWMREWLPFTQAPDAQGTLALAEYVPANDVQVSAVQYMQTDTYQMRHRTIEQAANVDIQWFQTAGDPYYFLYGDYRIARDTMQHVACALPIPSAPLTTVQGVVIRVPRSDLADADLLEVPELYMRAPIFYAVAEAFDSDLTPLKDPKKAEKWRMKYFDLVAEARAGADSRGMADVPESVVWN